MYQVFQIMSCSKFDTKIRIRIKKYYTCCLFIKIKEIIIIIIYSYPSCSGAAAPGLAADMHFRDNVIAFIGPACAFALEPVALLAAYWNIPIITGMGDQVLFIFI